MASDPAFDFRRLSIPERLELVEDIWDSIAEDATPDALPISEDHRAVLDQRFDGDERGAAEDRPWREVIDHISRRKR